MTLRSLTEVLIEDLGLKPIHDSEELTDGTILENSGEGHGGLLPGTPEEDASVSETGTRYPTTDGQHRSETAVFASEVDSLALHEVLERSLEGSVRSTDSGKRSSAGTGLSCDDSETRSSADELTQVDLGEDETEPELPPIRFVAFLGSGKTAVTIGTDGESQINLQVHPNFLDEVIDLLRRRNRVLKVTIQ